MGSLVTGVMNVVNAVTPSTWKWFAIGLAALFIAGVVVAGYLHVENIEHELQARTAELAQERVLRAAAEARSTAIQAEHDLQIGRINDLETQRTNIAKEVLTLRSFVEDLTLEEDIPSEDPARAKAALSALNSANARINRLLEDAAGNEVRSGKSPGSKAR